MTDNGKNEEKIHIILQEFRGNIRLYEELCTLNIKPLLEKLLADSGIKAQAVTARAKSYKSYEQKIRTRSEAGQKTKKYNEIRDLAGCRVIFYQEDDLGAFISVVREQFGVVHEKQEVNEDGYNATHLTVKLNAERSKLPEYKKFADMLCEIQFTTVLAHAWAEQNHDLIYKDQDQLRKFDPQGYEALDTELKAIMKEHLIPATRRFGIVQKKAERIREGQKIFNTDYLSSIPSIENNNEMYDQLKLLESYVKELSEEKTPDDVNIIDLLKKAIEQSKKNKVRQDVSIFGKTPGKNQLDIIDVVIDILDVPLLKYNHFSEVFAIFQEFSKHKNKHIKEKALKSIVDLAKYNYHVIKQVDYAFQLELITKLEKLPLTILMNPAEATIKMLEELLDTSFEGTSFDPKTQALTLHSGPLIATDDLKNIRKTALGILFRMYEKTKSFELKEQVMSAIQNATRLPHTGDCSDELVKLLEESGRQVINFFHKNAPEAPLALLLDMEEELIWLRKRFKRENLGNLEQMIDILKANDDYQVYRVLAGYPGRLTIDPSDLEIEKELREEKAEEFIDSFSQDTKELWHKRILNIANNYEPGGRRLIYFEEFLVKLGTKKPELVLGFINEHEEELGDYLNFLLKGVLTTGFKDQAIELIDGWIEVGKHLSQTVFAVWELSLDQKRLEKILEKALEKNEGFALIALLRLVFKSYAELPADVASKIIFSITGSLDSKRYRHWLEFVWYNKETLNQFVDSLSDSDIDVLLRSFIKADRIDYHFNDVLESIARKHPKKVMEFFKTRVLYKKNKRAANKDYFRYDAIPYHLDDLGVELRKHPKEVLPELVSWLSDKVPLLRWETAHFFSNLYPTFEDPLSTYLEEVVDTKDTKKIENIVLPVLREYKGQGFTHPVCKKIVKYYADKYDSDLFIALSQTGVVSGEYGFVGAYQAKQAEIKPWLEDEDSKVKAFAERYTAWLEKRIRWEKKRADDDKASREAGL